MDKLTWSEPDIFLCSFSVPKHKLSHFLGVSYFRCTGEGKLIERNYPFWGGGLNLNWFIWLMVTGICKNGWGLNLSADGNGTASDRFWHLQHGRLLLHVSPSALTRRQTDSLSVQLRNLITSARGRPGRHRRPSVGHLWTPSIFFFLSSLLSNPEM